MRKAVKRKQYLHNESLASQDLSEEENAGEHQGGAYSKQCPSGKSVAVSDPVEERTGEENKGDGLKPVPLILDVLVKICVHLTRLAHDLSLHIEKRDRT